MFNDKLVIVTYKNAIYQSKLKLLAIFITILVCKQHMLAYMFPPKNFVKTTFQCFWLF